MMDSIIDKNIILMGPPGGGKTTSAKMIAERLGLKSVDVDDDILEPTWSCPVSEKLKDVGDEKFVQFEGEALSNFDFNKQKNPFVLALTGSNPLHSDVPSEDIINRLSLMKVNRIVGQGTKSMSDILAYRKGFYEQYYDVRVLIPNNCTLQTKVEILHAAILNYFSKSRQANQRYESTRASNSSRDSSVSFQEAILKGLASDGGLYMPKDLPMFSFEDLKRLEEYADNYPEFALRVIERWVPELHPSILRGMINKAYATFPSKLTSKLDENTFILELFHGPTASFKDFALQLFPQVFDFISKKTQPNEKYCILVSTSGDTGSATVHGFVNHTNIPVMVLFPSEGVSPVQKAQMVTFPEKNLRITGVKSDFDFCQTSIKKIFNDAEFANHLEAAFGYRLSAANSINFGRLLPQVVYHMYSYLQLVKNKEINLGDLIHCCVPTGNFGNILAALLAKLTGLPLDQLVCASNDNNVLSDFFKTGCYDIRKRQLVKTSSPSIDILKASNLERMIYVITNGEKKSEIAHHFKQLDTEKFFELDQETKTLLGKHFWAQWCSDADAKQTIKDTYDKYGVLLDPHTAVAKFVADRFNEQPNITRRKMIIASTAHYSKFPEPVLEALNILPSHTLQEQIKQIKEIKNLKPLMHPEIESAVFGVVNHRGNIDASVDTIKSQVEEFLKRVETTAKL